MNVGVLRQLEMGKRHSACGINIKLCLPRTGMMKHDKPFFFIYDDLSRSSGSRKTPALLPGNIVLYERTRLFIEKSVLIGELYKCFSPKVSLQFFRVIGPEPRFAFSVDHEPLRINSHYNSEILFSWGNRQTVDDPDSAARRDVPKYFPSLPIEEKDFSI